MTVDRTVLRRHILVAAGAPVLAAAASLVAQLLLLPGAPDPIAIHWNALGVADGAAPAWTNLLITFAGALVLPLLLALLPARDIARGEGGEMSRFLGATAVWLSVFLGGIGVGALVVQQGAATWHEAGSIVPTLGISFAAAAVLAVAAWFALPRQPDRTAKEAEVAALPLASGEQAVWLRTAAVTGGALILLGAILALTVGISVLLWLMLGPGEPSTWITTGVTLLVIVAVALTVVFHVRVDASGLRARSAFGIIRYRVPIEDIVAIRLAQVSPLGDFGGYGLRFTATRTGIVTRAGEAIAVERRQGHEFVITVDDAATAASLLQAEVDRRAGDGT